MTSKSSADAGSLAAQHTDTWHIVLLGLVTLCLAAAIRTGILLRRRGLRNAAVLRELPLWSSAGLMFSS